MGIQIAQKHPEVGLNYGCQGRIEMLTSPETLALQGLRPSAGRVATPCLKSAGTFLIKVCEDE